jgi:hypothetical protein
MCAVMSHETRRYETVQTRILEYADENLSAEDERKKFDTQFKKAESNFKIAIVVEREV